MLNVTKAPWIVILGLALMLVGGGLMVKGFFIVDDKHETEFLGVEFSVTEERRETIPVMVSGAILVVGAVLTVVGAVRGQTNLRKD